MTKQGLLQLKAHYTLQISKAKKAIREAENLFIKKNAPYPVGTKLQIDDYGVKKDVQVQKYKVDKNGLLEPVYITLEGKAQFVHKPTIIQIID
jgi:hypothetical protein